MTPRPHPITVHCTTIHPHPMSMFLRGPRTASVLLALFVLGGRSRDRPPPPHAAGKPGCVIEAPTNRALAVAKVGQPEYFTDLSHREAVCSHGLLLRGQGKSCG